MPDKERDAIGTRNLTAENDGIKGQAAPSQYLWPLSLGEARTVGYDIASCGSNNIWLTSYYTPGDGYRDGLSILAAESVAGGTYSNFVGSNVSILPALSLDLAGVLFTSSTGDGGKSAASVGGGLWRPRSRMAR